MPEGEAKKPGPPGTKRVTTVQPRSGGVTTKRPAPAATATPPKRPAAPPPAPITEVVVDSGSHKIPEAVPERAAAAGPGVKGLSLRWKIVAGMAGVTVVTGILIFFVVYSRAQSQLNSEIDAKGVRLCNVLASIDPEYWGIKFETTQLAQDNLDGLVRTLAKSMAKDDKEVIKKIFDNPGLTERYGKVLKAGNNIDLWKVAIVSSESDTIDDVLTEALGTADWKKVLAALPPSANAAEDGPALRRVYENIRKHDLFDRKKLAPLSSFKKNKDVADDVINIVIKLPDASNQRNIVANEEAKSFSIKKGSEKLGNTNVWKGEDVKYRGEIHARSFYTFVGEEKNPAAEIYVLLSLAKIDEARSDLRSAILLPILIAAAAGIGIAVWISTFITNPLKRLMSDIDIVSQGNLEHETVSSSKDEVGLLASTFNKMTRALKAAHDQELEQEKIKHQLAVAEEIQQNLMPKRVLKIPGYDIGAFSQASQEVGGDYYDFFEIDEEHAGLIVADVSGKGVPGAIVMSMALAFFREEVDRTRNTSPSATLTRANRMLAANIKKGMFVTALYCILDKKTNQVSVASAGHNPLVVWRAAGNTVDLVNPSGIALGFDKGPLFERQVKEEKVQLSHGDRIVAYTDGTVEAMNEEDEEFGDQNFYQLIQQLATRDSNQFLNLIVKKLSEHQGNAPQHDDMTIVTMRYT